MILILLEQCLAYIPARGSIHTVSVLNNRYASFADDMSGRYSWRHALRFRQC
ncbi:hypothetical protein [Marseilla massiliensis]|uniref:hypothetical protein n=1 Tax=Marseilla massiliensis TaxID=1841864 RepID=UPI002011DB8A|nr:hypothetical protein [Marseilla massiliensis]MCL1609893.1 hypothetical protein [Marseilla massiliensis]